MLLFFSHWRVELKPEYITNELIFDILFILLLVSQYNYEQAWASTAPFLLQIVIFWLLSLLLLFFFNRGKTFLDHCPYIVITSHHWYPQQINGHRFDGKDGDFIRVPDHLLEVSASSHSNDATCRFIQVTEYSSQQWFTADDRGIALKNKVIS